MRHKHFIIFRVNKFIMNSERRKTVRVDLSGDYFFYPGKKNRKIKCIVKNVSATGACIISDDVLHNEDIIFLGIRGDSEVVLKSKAVWKIENQYGLLFLLETEEEFASISYIMNFEIDRLNKD